MTATESFLRSVWPDEGFYALATPFKPKGQDTVLYAHQVFDDISAALSFIDKEKFNKDIYFAVHTLKERRVWNPDKTDRKTGEKGAYQVRVQTNMRAAKCFFFDLDVGTGTDRAKKYMSQNAAAADLKRFCAETRLPKPTVTSSGGGLHVYWVISDNLPSEVWRQHAAKLRKLAGHHQLLADPSRTTDTASVLRVAGTRNLKDPLNPRPVRVLTTGQVTDTETFIQRLDDALVRAGEIVTAGGGVPGLGAAPAGVATLLGEDANIEKSAYEGPPVSIKALLTACGQLLRVAQAKGDVSEPEWYHALNAVRFAENGAKYAHKISEGHPQYSREQTDAKLLQLEEKGVAPTTCEKLAEVCGDEACLRCPFHGKVRSPVVAARFRDKAPAPRVEQVAGPDVMVTEVPEPPYPFTRLKSGGIAMISTNKEGEEFHLQIYDHDLFPMRRLVNTGAEIEQHVWRVVLPRGVTKDFKCDADALYDRRKFVATISNSGVFVASSHIQNLQDYMIAYIAELQRLADAEMQFNHLGWVDNQTSFIMPDKVLLSDGTAKPAMLGLGATRSTAAVHKRGTMERQLELLKFYARPAYTPHQFYVLGSLAAPIFHATGHHGVIVNASGNAGASKSTALYTAASLWGQPELYPINGTNGGATTRGRNERVTTLANLPICVDEITHMPVKDAVDLAMSITQPGHRIRLESSGVERAAPDSYKSTVMLATANNSLHGLLSVDNAAGTAGSMRVFEIEFERTLVHKKSEADDYLHDLRENYGHVAEVFMRYVVQNRERVEQRVREKMREVDTEVNTESSERFWTAVVAAVLVAGEIANELGLLEYDVEGIRQWALNKQIPQMRGIVRDEYSSPLGILADYLESINSDIIVVQKASAIGDNLSRAPTVIHHPRSAQQAHFDLDDKLMWVLKKPFKDYCARVGANYLKILQDLSQPKLDGDGKPHKVVSHTNCKKVLGAGTDYAKAQSWCFLIDMDHPDVSGSIDMKVVTGGGAITESGKTSLHVAGGSKA